jgi:hypothetical protein
LKKVYRKPRAAAKPPTEDFLTTLELLCRQKVGEVLQAVLEAEVDEFSVSSVVPPTPIMIGSSVGVCTLS